MSQFDQPQQHFSDYGTPLPGEKKKNTLGLVGFILSLTCCLSPIGLILSFLALFKAPRVLAVLGVIFGLVLSVVPLVTVMVGVAVASQGAAVGQLVQDTEAIGNAAEAYRTIDGSLPPDLATANAPTTDPWGTAYTYRLTDDGGNWVLTIVGPDATAGTADDLRIHRFTPDGAVELFYVISAITSPSFFGGALDQIMTVYTVAIDVAGLKAALRAHAAENGGQMPAALTDAAGIDAQLATDPWGTQYGYTQGFGVDSLSSAGPDGAFGTPDDLTMSQIGPAVTQVETAR